MFAQVHIILDWIIFAGQVLETSSEEVMKAIARYLSLNPHLIYKLYVMINGSKS